MTRLMAFVSVFLVIVAGAASGAGAPQLSALEIFDGMIHYEGDQLAADPGINDYRCKLAETTVRAGVDAKEILEKDLYFMEPVTQMQLIEDQPAFYFNDNLLVVLLESVDLVRQRDAEVNDIACYVIRTTPRDPAFAQYNRTYYVAKDDFRHVRTLATHATREFENLNTTISYTYGPADKFILLLETVAEAKDPDGNLLATTTTAYTDYEFGLGLDNEFFANYVEGKTPNVPLN